MSPAPVRHYDRTTIILHWVIGIGIILLAGTELIRHEFPRGSAIRVGLAPIHQPLGLTLFALILFRLVWRLTGARVPHVPGPSQLIDGLAKLMHLALWIMMLALPIIGLVAVLGNDKAINFGLFQIAIPLKGVIGGAAKQAREVHETLGTAMLVLALLHAAAALVHHYVLKDDVLARMRGGRGSPTPAE